LEPVDGARLDQRRLLRESALPNLINFCAPALDDDAEYDGTEHSSDDTNDGHGIHGVSSFPLV
jgi:hypothetical protein